MTAPTDNQAHDDLAMAKKNFERIVVETMRQSRDAALDAAIELCEDAARGGHSAECCVKMLRDLKESLPRPPSEAN